jgi:probable HAF family extracellular repeat protein
MTSYTFKSIDVPAAAGTYEFISVNGVDAAGEAVGNYGNVDGDGTFSGFVAPNNVGTTFNPPNSSNTDVVGITSNGEIFGDYTDEENRNHGFVDIGGGVETVDVFLATATNVYGVNDAGVIFGDYVDATGQKIHGFIDVGGSFTTVDVPNSASTSILGVNAAGEIVGTYTDAGGEAHGFTDIGGSFASFDPAGSILTSVVGESASGEVVGNYEDASGVDHGFIYQNGSITTIDIPGAVSTGVSAVNDSGEIVGYYLDSADNVHGFTDIGGTVSTVDVPGATETDILGVDAAGDIVGYYNDSHGHQHGFVADTVPCYCRGTLIETEHGDTPVENLRIGDKVITLSGEARTIKWIGRRSYGGRFVMGRTDILPICIKAGALNDNVPKRDLWISPHHAMYFRSEHRDGMLIEAKDLINGVSIVQMRRVDKVEYFHIELETHDVIVAEGALSETFLDDDSRAMFHNAHEYAALHPDDTRQPACYCASRLEDGYEVEAARRRIATRAGLASDDQNANASSLRGYIDLVGVDSIEGWAQNIDHPDAPVCLDIFAGDQLIGRVLANVYRADLARAGVGSGRHSFAFSPPKDSDFDIDAVHVRRSLDGATLLRSALRTSRATRRGGRLDG